MQAREAVRALRPEQLHTLFVGLLNAGDLERLLALYEPDAVMASGPGKRVAGSDAIREAYRALLTMRPRIEVHTLEVLAMDEGLALAHGRWSMTGTCQDGSAMHMTGRNTEVLRRQPDGAWLFAIDNPFTPE